MIPQVRKKLDKAIKDWDDFSKSEDNLDKNKGFIDANAKVNEIEVALKIRDTEMF